jgi:hydrogenase maturation protease
MEMVFKKARIESSMENFPFGESLRFIPDPASSRTSAGYAMKSSMVRNLSPSQFVMGLLKDLFPIPEKDRDMEIGKKRVNREAALGINRRKPLILVAGLGNVQFQDDGVGVHVVRELQKNPAPKIVCAEVGTVVLGALHLFEWADKILAIDAMRAAGKPGTVYTVGINDVGRPGPRASLHQETFLSAFKFLSRRTLPEIHIIGIEPETTAYGPVLSPSVQASISNAVQTARKMIQIWMKG